MMYLRAAWLLILLLPLVVAGQNSTATKSRDVAATPSRQAQADRCRRLLESSVIDFYFPHSIDRENGGYLEVIDSNGQFVAGDKFLTLQARQLWFFSTLAVAGIRTDETRAAAKTGYDCLRDKFFDDRHGGYFTKVSPSGEVVDRRKHVYPSAFVIYAFVEYHRATGQREPLQLAMNLFQTLEKHCHDKMHGGYNEFFYDDWTPVTDPKESGYIGAIGTKTYNSHLHLLEAFAQLYRETDDELVGKRLAELIDINVDKVRHPDYPCNIDGWNPDWTMVKTEHNLRASFGHDVECAWLVLDAADALGIDPKTLVPWAKEIVAYAMEYGYDAKHRGFFYTGPLGKQADDRKKEWWTQSEALVSMLTLEKLTGDSAYRRYFAETLDFIEQKQIAKQGGWWATLNEDGSLGQSRSRTSMWQGAYHNGRALLRCEQLLRR